MILTGLGFVVVAGIIAYLAYVADDGHMTWLAALVLLRRDRLSSPWILAAMSAELRVIEPNPHVHEEVVRVLERYLSLARKGEIVTVGVAAVTRDRCVETDWSSGSTMSLLGAINRLNYRVNAKTDESPDMDPLEAG